MACRAVCHQLAGWLHAYPAIGAVGALLVMAAVFRLARRGRWLTILGMIAIWIVMATLIGWVFP